MFYSARFGSSVPMLHILRTTYTWTSPLPFKGRFHGNIYSDTLCATVQHRICVIGAGGHQCQQNGCRRQPVL